MFLSFQSCIHAGLKFFFPVGDCSYCSNILILSFHARLVLPGKSLFSPKFFIPLWSMPLLYRFFGWSITNKFKTQKQIAGLHLSAVDTYSYFTAETVWRFSLLTLSDVSDIYDTCATVNGDPKRSDRGRHLERSPKKSTLGMFQSSSSTSSLLSCLPGVNKEGCHCKQNIMGC